MMSGTMTSGVTQSFAFARRHVSGLFYVLALVGVPLGVIYGTGGLHTIGFWAMAVLWLPISMVGLMPFAMFILIPLVPVLWLADKLLSGRLEKYIDRVLPVFWGVFALVVYVLGVDLGYTGDVWLPTPWPNVGALLVMAVATATFVGLMWLGGRLEVPRRGTSPRPNPLPTPRYQGHWNDHAEPAEEFWSDEMVEGWRSWNWEGGCLHGVWDAWPTEEYRAKCGDCEDVPRWNHSCGIYAVKDPRNIYRFHRGTEVVGRVEMWGSVIEHEHGYRAERARITDLWVASEPLAREITDRYEVNVHVGSPDRKEMSSWQT